MKNVSIYENKQNILLEGLKTGFLNVQITSLISACKLKKIYRITWNPCGFDKFTTPLSHLVPSVSLKLKQSSFHFLKNNFILHINTYFKFNFVSLKKMSKY